MKTQKQLLIDAYRVQDASNLSGVVQSFNRALADLCEHARPLKYGTDWVNTHPVAMLYASKIADLTRCEDTGRLTEAFTLAIEAVEDDRLGG